MTYWLAVIWLTLISIGIVGFWAWVVSREPWLAAWLAAAGLTIAAMNRFQKGQ